MATPLDRAILYAIVSYQNAKARVVRFGEQVMFVIAAFLITTVVGWCIVDFFLDHKLWALLLLSLLYNLWSLFQGSRPPPDHSVETEAASAIENAATTPPEVPSVSGTNDIATALTAGTHIAAETAFIKAPTHGPGELSTKFGALQGHSAHSQSRENIAKMPSFRDLPLSKKYGNSIEPSEPLSQHQIRIENSVIHSSIKQDPYGKKILANEEFVRSEACAAILYGEDESARLQMRNPATFRLKMATSLGSTKYIPMDIYQFATAITSGNFNVRDVLLEPKSRGALAFHGIHSDDAVKLIASCVDQIKLKWLNSNELGIQMWAHKIYITISDRQARLDDCPLLLSRETLLPLYQEAWDWKVAGRVPSRLRLSAAEYRRGMDAIAEKRKREQELELERKQEQEKFKRKRREIWRKGLLRYLVLQVCPREETEAHLHPPREVTIQTPAPIPPMPHPSNQPAPAPRRESRRGGSSRGARRPKHEVPLSKRLGKSMVAVKMRESGVSSIDEVRDFTTSSSIPQAEAILELECSTAPLVAITYASEAPSTSASLQLTRLLTWGEKLQQPEFVDAAVVQAMWRQAFRDDFGAFPEDIPLPDGADYGLVNDPTQDITEQLAGFSFQDGEDLSENDNREASEDDKLPGPDESPKEDDPDDDDSPSSDAKPAANLSGDQAIEAALVPDGSQLRESNEDQQRIHDAAEQERLAQEEQDRQEQDRQAQAEADRAREAEQKRQTELEQQRQEQELRRAQEAENKRQVEREQQRQEQERQPRLEQQQRKARAEAEAQRTLEAEEKRKAELEQQRLEKEHNARQAEEQRKTQEAAERERPAQAEQQRAQEVLQQPQPPQLTSGVQNQGAFRFTDPNKFQANFGGPSATPIAVNQDQQSMSFFGAQSQTPSGPTFTLTPSSNSGYNVFAGSLPPVSQDQQFNSIFGTQKQTPFDTPFNVAPSSNGDRNIFAGPAPPVNPFFAGLAGNGTNSFAHQQPAPTLQPADVGSGNGINFNFGQASQSAAEFFAQSPPVADDDVDMDDQQEQDDTMDEDLPNTEQSISADNDDDMDDVSDISDVDEDVLDNPPEGIRHFPEIDPLMSQPAAEPALDNPLGYTDEGMESFLQDCNDEGPLTTVEGLEATDDDLWGVIAPVDGDYRDDDDEPADHGFDSTEAPYEENYAAEGDDDRDRFPRRFRSNEFVDSDDERSDYDDDNDLWGDAGAGGHLTSEDFPDQDLSHLYPESGRADYGCDDTQSHNPLKDDFGAPLPKGSGYGIDATQLKTPLSGYPLQAQLPDKKEKTREPFTPPSYNPTPPRTGNPPNPAIYGGLGSSASGISRGTVFTDHHIFSRKDPVLESIQIPEGVSAIEYVKAQYERKVGQPSPYQFSPPVVQQVPAAPVPLVASSSELSPIHAAGAAKRKEKADNAVADLIAEKNKAPPAPEPEAPAADEEKKPDDVTLEEFSSEIARWQKRHNETTNGIVKRKCIANVEELEGLRKVLEAPAADDEKKPEDMTLEELSIEIAKWQKGHDEAKTMIVQEWYAAKVERLQGLRKALEAKIVRAKQEKEEEERRVRREQEEEELRVRREQEAQERQVLWELKWQILGTSGKMTSRELEKEIAKWQKIRYTPWATANESLQEKIADRVEQLQKAYRAQLVEEGNAKAFINFLKGEQGEQEREKMHPNKPAISKRRVLRDNYEDDDETNENEIEQRGNAVREDIEKKREDKEEENRRLAEEMDFDPEAMY